MSLGRLPPGQGAEAGWLSPPQRQLPVRGQSEGLPGLPHQRTVSSPSPEAPVPGTHHLLPAAPSSPGTEPNSRLSARNGAASDHCRGNLCVVGRVGMGKIPAERIVEEPALEKSGVECGGFMASFAHNVLKEVRRSRTALRGLQPALRAGSGAGDHQFALRRVDRGPRLGASHRRAAGPPHSPRPYPGVDTDKRPASLTTSPQFRKGASTPANWPGERPKPTSRLSNKL